VPLRGNGVDGMPVLGMKGSGFASGQCPFTFRSCPALARYERSSLIA
jgi:hypothetical protein